MTNKHESESHKIHPVCHLDEGKDHITQASTALAIASPQVATSSSSALGSADIYYELAFFKTI